MRKFACRVSFVRTGVVLLKGFTLTSQDFMKKIAKQLCLCSQNSVPILVSVQVVHCHGMCLLKGTLGLKQVNLKIYLMSLIYLMRENPLSAGVFTLCV